MARRRKSEERMEPLTAEEQRLAIEYHHYIKPFLECDGLDYNEYYDIVIGRYLWTIHRYCTEPDLQKWKLITILKRAVVSTAIDYKTKRKDNQCLSLDFEETDDGERTLYSYVVCSQTIGDLEQLFTKTGLTRGQRKTLKAVKQVLTAFQLDVMQMVGNGLSRTEIAELLGCPASKVASTITSVRRKVEQGKLVYTR